MPYEEFETSALVMSYIDGMDLADILRRYREKKQQFPAPQALRIVYQICQGLNVCHQKGIVHRDLKPGNVLVKRDGGVVITDFGLSLVSGGESRPSSGMTTPGTIIGTFAYMAPEQLLDTKVDDKADIYSLGVIMYEMFTNRRPYTSNSILGWATQIRNKIPDRPSLLIRSFPNWLDQIIMKCLEKDPSKRFQNVEILRQAFKKKEL